MKMLRRRTSARQSYRPTFDALETRDVPTTLVTTLVSSTGTERVNLTTAAAILSGALPNPVQPPDDQGHLQDGRPYELATVRQGPTLPEGYFAKPGTVPERSVVLGIGVLGYEALGKVYLDVHNDPDTGSVLPAHDVAELIASGFDGSITPPHGNFLYLKAVPVDGGFGFWGSQVSNDPTAADQPRFDLIIPYQVVPPTPASPDTCCREAAQGALRIELLIDDANAQLDLLKLSSRGKPKTPASIRRYKRQWHRWEQVRANASQVLAAFIGEHVECAASIAVVLDKQHAIADTQKAIRWLTLEHPRDSHRGPQLQARIAELTAETSARDAALAALAC